MRAPEIGGTSGRGPLPTSAQNPGSNLLLFFQKLILTQAFGLWSVETVDARDFGPSTSIWPLLYLLKPIFILFC